MSGHYPLSRHAYNNQQLATGFSHPSFSRLPSSDFTYSHFHYPQPRTTVHPPPDARFLYTYYYPASLPNLTSNEEIGPYGAAPDDDMNLGGINFSELGRRYRITAIQSPVRGASFEGAYLSRLALAPPLILQLDCWDADGELTIPYDELPFLVCHLSLQRTDGEDASMVVGNAGTPSAMLYGTLVATPAEMNDIEGAQGIYFAFPDVSVRHVGSFKLCARLHRITGGPPLDSTISPNFDVVKDADYIAPPTTDLTRHFDAQGVVRFGLPRSDY